MKKIEATLKGADHEIIPWKVDQKAALSILLRVFASDASGDIDRSRAVSGKPARDLVTNIDPSNRPLTLLESWSLACERLAFQASGLEQWKQTSKVGTSDDVMDFYRAPVNPALAPRHGHYAKGKYIIYTGSVNALDYTACTVPIGFVDPALHRADRGEALDCDGMEIPGPTNELDKHIRDIYEPERYRGMPITVQIVGRRLEEEKILGVAAMLEKLLREG
jgi:amidase